MGELEPIGRTLIIVGIVVAVIGVFIVFGPRIPFLGRLPGDIRIERDGLVVFIPLGTMLLVSVVASIVLAVLGRR